MPRPRKPTNVLEFTGALAKNPQRREARKHEPMCKEPIGFAPEELPAHAKLAWERIVADCPRGVLTKRDRLAVQATAMLAGRMIRGEDDAKLLSQLRVFLGELGMTPASASKVSAPTNEDEEASLAAL